MSPVDQILSGVKISEIYHSLTGKPPRRTGADTFRAPAAWRKGDGLNVSMDDSRGIWHDFVTDEGGGVLDLIVRLRGGNRQDALRWLAGFAGVPLEDKPLSPVEREDWARRQREIEAILPTARYWRAEAVCTAETILTEIKSRLFDPLPPAPDDLSQPAPLRGKGIFELEEALTRLRALEGADLVADFRGWERDYPGMTAMMVRSAKHREHAAQRALLAYLRGAA